MGFTITGPGAFLSSGHPGPGEQVANPLGVVTRTDAGATWTALGLVGEVDFHALETVPGIVYGYDATNQVLRASTDGGASWDTRAALAALDIAADPADPAVVLATVQGSVAASNDGGRSFTPPAGPALAYCPGRPAARCTASASTVRCSPATPPDRTDSRSVSCPAGARRPSPRPAPRCWPPPPAGCTAPTTAAPPSTRSPDRAPC